MTMKPIIAIDGPAAAGKGTLARRLAARHWGCPYPGHRPAVSARWDDLRCWMPVAIQADPATAESGGADRCAPRTWTVPICAARRPTPPRRRSPPFQTWPRLLAFQRDFAEIGNGAVLDGRDIGTVIFP